MKNSNETFEIQIEKLVEGGRGLGFLEGRPVFIHGVLPGEKVRAEITRRHRQFFEAETAEILEQAPARVEARCHYFGRCGGCQWQHIDYAAQLKWKREIVRETLQRIGKIENPSVLETIPSPQIWNWRSRVTLHQNEKGEIGFFEPASTRVVDIEKCLISDETINEQLAALRTRPLQSRRQKRDFEVRSTALPGFTQVNPAQNENLKRLVKSWAEKIPHDHVVELFCGSGNFTQMLAPMTKKIVAVDSERTSIDLALSQFPEEQFPQIDWVCGDAVRFFAQYQPQTPLDLLVLDPPRDGAGGMVEGVIKHHPLFLIYISCNPATLARDLKYLKDFAGYSLVQTQPIDMFPMSFHIESISLIQHL